MKNNLWLLVLLAGGLALWAQTNTPAADGKAAASDDDPKGDIMAQATTAPFRALSGDDQKLHLTCDHFRGSFITYQGICDGNVVVTNSTQTLHATCGRLTVWLGKAGLLRDQATNAVAETNVVINYVDKKGMTNQATADKMIYTFDIVNGVTNQLITLTGHAQVSKDGNKTTGEPMIWDNINQTFDVTGQSGSFQLPASSSGNTNGGNTNKSLLNLLK